MAWEARHLPLVLLLLASGSWAQVPESEMVWAVQGQAVSVKCESSPQQGEYKRKIWCKERTSSGGCFPLVTSSEPQKMAQKTRYFMWDNSAAGFFIVTMMDFRKTDIGHYLCGMYPDLGVTFTVLKNISLLMTSVTSPVSVAASEHSLPANTFLVVLLCGLLVTKVLVLMALLLLLTCRALGYANTVRIATMAAPSPAKTPGPMGTPH